ncbi:MAG: trypsin-like serine protease, partial [Planctomycetes bacterium]|nr:trypsin-like serine protease [Planctomycetota bacterium]
VSGRLVGGDPLTDVAVIKLDPKELRDKGFVKPAVLGNSDELQMGDFVLALGSPMALSRSMTWGIVSNPRRYLSDAFRLPTGERTGSFNTWIQTDASINPGNSGGPLVNLKGEVVGVNARIVGFADGLGFAIPVNVVKDVTARLMATGKISPQLDRRRVPAAGGRGRRAAEGRGGQQRGRGLTRAQGGHPRRRHPAGIRRHARVRAL